ncbi:hypothetical protein MATL_G00219350 [Megalops atlanticus]|uniref:Uncharacterized protein n=1 Tax=Megalops atlanticus TaxID=7932 RepID=A0A9D3SXJ6_MEGAT|nr:hypothetical protein MATL_G00219350 [Megalops atlanticus]
MSVFGGNKTQNGVQESKRVSLQRSKSPAPSYVSVKSEKSMELPVKFSNGYLPPDLQLQPQRSGSPGPSWVSVKSEKSMELPVRFSDGPLPPDPRLLSELQSSV